MRKILFILGITLILITTGCDDSSTTKNIYHSKWVSSDGYKLLIADPVENNTITKESCSVYMGEDTLGTCIATFDKSAGTVRITWSYFKCHGSFDCNKYDSATISSDTSEFTLNDITFKYDSNLKTSK